MRYWRGKQGTIVVVDAGIKFNSGAAADFANRIGKIFNAILNKHVVDGGTADLRQSRNLHDRAALIVHLDDQGFQFFADLDAGAGLSAAPLLAFRFGSCMTGPDPIGTHFRFIGSDRGKHVGDEPSCGTFPIRIRSSTGETKTWTITVSPAD